MTHPIDTPLPTILADTLAWKIRQHPDLAQLDVYLDWLYGDGPAPEGIKS